MSEDRINLEIGRAEALILFELLFDYHNQSTLEMSDAAQRIALARLHGALEKTLVEPFMDNYRETVEKARSLLIAESGVG